MRLTCPNCNAQYEVPDEVIPETGRDVQCSNCEKTWFQHKHPKTAAPEPTISEAVSDTAPPAEPVAPPADTVAPSEEYLPEAAPADVAPAPRSRVDPAVASILQQEAKREAELRAKEGTGLESQPDLGLKQPADPAPAHETPAATETASAAGQKDALPDVELINSTLRSRKTAETEAPAEAPPRKSGGFLRGFALILIIGVILFLIYGNARQISEAVPQAEPALQSYVSLIDQARVWLEAQTGSAAE
ncbi:conserved hypothetical protein [Ruegeria lacuscaerulensis ITI-1157]|nr:conserved hypothetical protein [Ruegeria lacuscaerulensis ITI-1157]SHJ41431.1 MJ0042 family finger-like domain-containing protein [Ruegeria lacuscaerulensis ITI-1157]